MTYAQFWTIFTRQIAHCMHCTDPAMFKEMWKCLMHAKKTECNYMNVYGFKPQVIQVHKAKVLRYTKWCNYNIFQNNGNKRKSNSTDRQNNNDPSSRKKTRSSHSLERIYDYENNIQAQDWPRLCNLLADQSIIHLLEDLVHITLMWGHIESGAAEGGLQTSKSLKLSKNTI